MIAGIVLGLLLLFQEECINPLLVDGACPTPTEVVTAEPTPEPTETPTLRPTLTPTETPVPRPTPTLRPTLEIPELPTLPEFSTPTPRPTRMPGPDRATDPWCLAAPPPLPDVPEILARDWTDAERCGGTPEAQATQIELERPTREPTLTPTPRPPVERTIEVATREPTETPRPEPTRMPIGPPVQLPT